MYFPGIIICLLIMYNDIALFVCITGYMPVRLLKDIFVASTVFSIVLALLSLLNKRASSSLNES